MKHFWLLCLGPLLLQAAELPPVARTEEEPPAGPKPFPFSHYDLLMEYSPFVKSAEASKETEKSPELVVVGYGRIAGESHVIIQSKDNSEKREKIGSRFGSKDFPYRLLSVTNASDRKKFLAVLEDRKNRKYEIRYASESTPPPGSIGGTVGGKSLSSNPAGLMGGAGNSGGVTSSTSLSAAKNLSLGLDTTTTLMERNQKLQAKFDDPATPDTEREKIQNAINLNLEKLKQFQGAQEFISPEIKSDPIQ